MAQIADDESTNQAERHNSDAPLLDAHRLPVQAAHRCLIRRGGNLLNARLNGLRASTIARGRQSACQYHDGALHSGAESAPNNRPAFPHNAHPIQIKHHWADNQIRCSLLPRPQGQKRAADSIPNRYWQSPPSHLYAAQICARWSLETWPQSWFGRSRDRLLMEIPWQVRFESAQ